MNYKSVKIYNIKSENNIHLIVLVNSVSIFFTETIVDLVPRSLLSSLFINIPDNHGRPGTTEFIVFLVIINIPDNHGRPGTTEFIVVLVYKYT